MKPANEWNEEYLLSLPTESDAFERKGFKLLDLTLPGVKESEVRDELAKQLSAFANSGGGAIIYGLTNDGVVDSGGVSQMIRGRQSTKEWLENIIPLSVEYEIVGVNVYEVAGGSPTSAIQPDKALYVVDVPDSDRAPHQSTRDDLYYVRLGSHSLPASHRLIEDIRNRVRHPSLTLFKSEILNVSLIQGPGFPLATLQVAMRLTIKNTGHIKATNVCVLVRAEDGRFGVAPHDYPGIAKSRPAIPNGVYWEFAHPSYPEMETHLDVQCNVPAECRKVTRGTLDPSFFVRETETCIGDLAASVKIFADSAPPKPWSIKLGELGLNQKALAAWRP